MRRTVARAIAAILCAGATLVVPALPAAARPAHVGIVVQFGPGRVSTACARAGGSGLAVLEDSGYSVVIGRVPPYAGFVFTINGTGTTRPDDTHYWSYWRSSGNGGWAYSGTGAGSSTPAAGTVEGWSYVNGTSTAPAPPTYTYVSVCAGADPKPPPPRTSSRAYAPPPPEQATTRAAPRAGSTAPAVAPTAASPPGPRRTARPSAHRTPTPPRTSGTAHPVPNRTGPSPATSPGTSSTAAPTTPAASPAAHQSHGSGLPAWGTVLAILVVLALGAGAWLQMRRRT